ncbi:MAG: bifunctional metallophosphatase/5'-nucleotidase [Bacteroidales bacterium]|nr:bifunctional metallophosphatase/5'-nucleotidase [Bacteroidales bacterium]
MKKLILVILALSIFSCSENIQKPDSYKLVIVETSDVHGSIFDYDFINDRFVSGSLSKVHTYVSELRKSNNVILLDNGDILQGQPLVYYSNFEDTSNAHICSKVMNYMHYDAATIGNHDIEAGHLVYDKLKNEFNFPWLAANALNKEDKSPYFEPYKIFIKNGVKIAILGLITPGIPNWLPEELWEGIEFEDMLISARKWVPEIIKNENPDLLIGLFHSGFDYKYANLNYDTPKNENASLIVAEQVPGFDIIFVGHDHNTWNETVKNINGENVLVIGPTSGARQVVAATIDFRLNENGDYNKNITGEIIEMKDVKVDSLFNVEFRTEFQEVEKYVSKKVGEFNQSINTHDALYGPSIFIDLIQEIQLDISGADISFAAPLSLNSVIDKGPVYVKDMFKLYRFENFLYTINLTGTEIDHYLEYSFANWFNTMQSEKDHLLMFKPIDKNQAVNGNNDHTYSLKNSYYNFDVASGIRYTIDVSKPINEKVEILSMSDNSEFFTDSIYKVAINSYRGNGGGGHLINGVGLTKEELLQRRITSTDKDLRYYMMKWIEEKGKVNPELKSEWSVIPDEWWLKAKEIDKKIMNK